MLDAEDFGGEKSSRLLSGEIGGNYSGLPLSTGAKKRAVTVMAAPPQPKQRVHSESAAGTGTDSVEVQLGRWRALRRSEAADLSSYGHFILFQSPIIRNAPFLMTVGYTVWEPWWFSFEKLMVFPA